MLYRFRFMLMGIAMVLAAAGVSYAVVSAAIPSANLPAGTTRYAVVSATASDQVLVSDGWQLMDGMTKYFDIPVSTTADVIVQWCGEVTPAASDIVFVKAVIAGTSTLPVHETASGMMCALWYKTNVPAGTKSVKIWWFANSTSAIVETRSLVVTLNIH